MKKIWKHLFNQNMLYILLMLVQIAFLVLSVLFLNRNYAWVYGALLLLNGLLIIYITNSRKNPTYIVLSVSEDPKRHSYFFSQLQTTDGADQAPACARARCCPTPIQ